MRLYYSLAAIYIRQKSKTLVIFNYICHEKQKTIRYNWIQASKKEMRKLELEIIKYFPILGNLFFLLIFFEFWINNGYLISSFCEPYFGYSLLISLFFLVLSLNRRFCIWHKLLICNMIFNNILSITEFNHTLEFIISSVCALVFILSTVLIFAHGFRKR